MVSSYVSLWTIQFMFGTFFHIYHSFRKILMHYLKCDTLCVCVCVCLCVRARARAHIHIYTYTHFLYIRFEIQPLCSLYLRECEAYRYLISKEFPKFWIFLDGILWRMIIGNIEILRTEDTNNFISQVCLQVKFIRVHLVYILRICNAG